MAESVPASRAPRPPLSMFAIPEELGKIEARIKGNSNRWVIHIQDIHGHFEAQENVAAIVDQLTTIYGVRTIAMEGGWQTTSFPKSWALPSSRAKQDLARGLLEEEYITGPAYSALFAPLPVRLVGIEDKDLYAQNRKSFLNNLKSRESIDEKITLMEDAIALQKAEIFNQSLLRFHHRLMDFREGQNSEKFLSDLIPLTEKLQVDTSDLEQVVLFKKIFSMEKSLDKEKLKAESDRLTKAYKKKRLNFEELLRSNKIPDEKLQHYPALKKYMRIMELQDQMKPRDFFNEIEKVITQIKNVLFKSDAERSLDKKSEQLVIAKRILALKATPNDLRFFEDSRTAIQAQMQANSLEEALNQAVRFYKLAKKRDAVFFKQITSNPKLKGNIILVAGGFHTDGISEQLEKSGISHIIITPSLGKEFVEPNEELYYKRLKDNVANQTLSAIQNRFFPKSFDDGFAEAYAFRKINRDNNRAIEIVVGYMQGKASVEEAALAIAEFMGLERIQQKEQVKSWLAQTKNAKLPVVHVIKTSSLKELFKDRRALTAWEQVIAPERANIIGELQDIDDYLEQTIGINARVVRLPFGSTAKVDSVVDRRFVKAKKENRIVAIGEKGTGLLELPLHRASLLLARIMIEQGVERSDQPEFFDLVGELLEEIFVEEGFLTAA